MSAALPAATADHDFGRPNGAIHTSYAALFDGVDDLIHRIADAENPEILKSRAKVYAAMVIAKSALEQRANQAPAVPTQFSDSIDDFFLDYSEQTLGVALLIGLGLGFITSLRQAY